MKSQAERYIREMHSSLRYWATWVPSVEIKLGDFGPIDDWVFKPQGNVRDYLKFAVDPAPASGPISHTSDNAMSVSFQLQGGAQKIPQIPQGTAGIQIKFSRENAIVFAAVGAGHSRIANIFNLSRQVLDLIGQGTLPPDFVVVTEVVTAESATVLLSESDNSEYVASASADLKAGIVDIGNASLNITTQFTDKVQTDLVATNQVTPLFRGIKLRGFFRDRMGGLESAQPQEVPFMDLDPDTLDA